MKLHPSWTLEYIESIPDRDLRDMVFYRKPRATPVAPHLKRRYKDLVKKIPALKAGAIETLAAVQKKTQELWRQRQAAGPIIPNPLEAAHAR